MNALIRSITFDCHDNFALADFWSRVTGYREDPSDPNNPGDTEVLLVSPNGGPRLLFINVPESKVAKNRIHMDLMPADGTRDQEVERVIALGATVVADHRKPDGSGWVVMADPEGNEFCVERSAAEHAVAENS